MPSKGYTQNFATGQDLKAYSTFLYELECEIVDTSVSLTPFEWANGYTLYVFRITDGLIKQEMNSQRFKFATESARMEVSFAAAVNENIQMVLLYQMLDRIEFDRFTAVLVL